MNIVKRIEEILLKYKYLCPKSNTFIKDNSNFIWDKDGLIGCLLYRPSSWFTFVGGIDKTFYLNNNMFYVNGFFLYSPLKTISKYEPEFLEVNKELNKLFIEYCQFVNFERRDRIFAKVSKVEKLV